MNHRAHLVGVSLLVWAGLTVRLAGTEGGDSVMVVYNARMPESKGVAEHYAQQRKVPTNQVIGIKLPVVETMTRAEYREQLQKPLLQELEQRKLFRFGTEAVPADSAKGLGSGPALAEAKVRYAVLCYGVPLRIASNGGFQEDGAEQLPKDLRRNEAAVDSELACLPLAARNHRLAGLLVNPVYATTNAARLHPTNGILMVARLDGPTEDIARALVDKAMQAERDGLWGRAYFDARGLTNGNYKPGDDWIQGAAKTCQRQGFETILDNQPGTFAASFPMSQIAFYAGWYDGNVSGPFARPTVEFMPGAFAYHLHSFSAATLRSETSNWAGPLLAKGVTATMGSVFEPYLMGTPDIAMFFDRLIVRGFSFGEAAYASTAPLSWQTTMVGDPLYRPFGRSPQQVHEELVRRGSKLVEWSHLRVVDLNLATGVREGEMIGYLEQVPLTRQSAVLTEKLADLYVAVGKPASAVHSYEQVLKLAPTPQQKVRVMLLRAEKLAVLERPADALAVYQQFLKEFSDYPDRRTVVQKALPLAEKLGRKSELDGYLSEFK